MLVFDFLIATIFGVTSPIPYPMSSLNLATAFVSAPAATKASTPSLNMRKILKILESVPYPKLFAAAS